MNANGKRVHSFLTFASITLYGQVELRQPDVEKLPDLYPPASFDIVLFHSDPAFFAQLEKLEMAVRDKFPYYLTARSWHLIAHKR